MAFVDPSGLEWVTDQNGNQYWNNGNGTISGGPGVASRLMPEMMVGVPGEAAGVGTRTGRRW
jgi:hypothetical protein